MKRKIDSITKEMEARIAEKDETIRKLSDEIKEANNLLEEKDRLSRIEEDVSVLSSSAAAAAVFYRKGGGSLTSLYTEHRRVLAELEETKAENKRMESYFRELLDDVETKAPYLSKQREEYEAVSEMCENLKDQLRAAEDERERLLSSRDEVGRELTYTKTELEHYQRENEDLARQLTHLLHAYEVGRMMNDRDADSPPMSDEDKDILWSSIGELQKTNQKLMAALRRAETDKDKAIADANSHEYVFYVLVFW
ncbi:hypothetical protein AB6A40_010968 [Gnathostoma spinigerum]|uniref:Uncharacterized protein n=1 Tax=Gnathostoma spinigerum TaxID=75299 RepID=A0ABD6F2K3_9BILA